MLILRGVGRLEPPQRENKEENLGRGEGRAAAVDGRTWGEPVGSTGLLCHLTNPQENPHHLLRLLELECYLFGMQPHTGSRLKAVRGEPAQPWVAHSYTGDMISQ